MQWTTVAVILFSTFSLFANAGDRHPKKAIKPSELSLLLQPVPVKELAKIEPAKTEHRADAHPAVEKAAVRTPASVSSPLRTEEPQPVSRQLSSENKEEDLAHYHHLSRRVGVDVGMFIPMGAFQTTFESAPMFGLHFTWEAIEPFGLSFAMKRASAAHKDGTAAGKLTVSTFNIGGQASFHSGRYVPFIKFDMVLAFNDVSIAATPVTNGNDSMLTSMGASLGIGTDFVIGREVSFGLEASYTYMVPKKVTLTGGSTFDLGSSFAMGNLRLNF